MRWEVYIPRGVVCLVLLCGSLCGVAWTDDYDDDSVEPEYLPMLHAIPMKLVNNRIVLRANFGGNDLHNLLLDNACYHTILDGRRIRMGEFAPDYEVTSTALDRRDISGTVGRIEKLGIGTLILANAEVRESDIFTPLTRSLKLRVEGILGYQTMLPYLVTIDFEHRCVFMRASTPRAIEVLSAEPAVQRIPFSPGPLTERNRHVVTVPIEMNGHIVSAVLDLGYPGTVLCVGGADKYGIPVVRNGNRTNVRMLGCSFDAFVSSVDEIKFGGMTLNNVRILCGADEELPELVILGVGVLRHFTLTLDYGNRQAFVLPGQHEAAHSYYR
jgi:hypothetical protein